MVINTYPRKHQYLTVVASLQLILISGVAENNRALSLGYNYPFLSPQLPITVSFTLAPWGEPRSRAPPTFANQQDFQGSFATGRGERRRMDQRHHKRHCFRETNITPKGAKCSLAAGF